MDAEFERRWRDGLPPFDGWTVTVHESVSLSRLQPALAAAVDVLVAEAPESCLLRLLDWHEHDGILLEAQTSDWHELFDLIATEDALQACFLNADWAVAEGFFPASRDFYLRLWIDYQSMDVPPVGRFDVTGTESLTSRVTEAVRDAGLLDLARLPAKEFFDRRYAG